MSRAQQITARRIALRACEKGLERFADGGHWTRGTFARNAACAAVSPWGPEATCWCLAGSLVLGPPPNQLYALGYRAPGMRAGVLALARHPLIAPFVGRPRSPGLNNNSAHDAVIEFNDFHCTSVEPVLTVLRETVARLREEIADLEAEVEEAE